MNLINLFSLVLVSFILNSFLIVLVQRNYFGSDFGVILNRLCRNKINLVTFYYFIFISVAFLIIKLNINYVYLDTIINIQLGETHFELHGDYIQQVATYFGDVAAFSIGARLAFALLAKSGGANMPSKIGIMVGSGVGHMAAFNVMRNSNQYLNGMTNVPANVSGALNINEAHITVQQNARFPYLSNLLGNNISGYYTPMQPSTIHHYTYEVQGIKIHSNFQLSTTELYSQLRRQGYNPNFGQIQSNVLNPDTFTIQSPLEENSRLVSYLLENLNYHLILASTTLYLLMMLSLILITKFYFVSNVNIGFLNSLIIYK